MAITTRSSRSAAGPTFGSGATQTSIPLPEVRGLLVYLASERGLAENSLKAYRRDLEDITRWLGKIGRNLLTAAPNDYRRYLQSQTTAGRSTFTLARRVATMRVFLAISAQQPKYAEHASGGAGG